MHVSDLYAALRVLGIVLFIFWGGMGIADVPTAQEECVQRNLAVCQFPSGVQTTQPGPCPAGSLTLKPQGVEDCGVMRAYTPATPVDALQPAQIHDRAGNPSSKAGREGWLVPLLISGLAGVVLLWTAWRWIRRRKQESDLSRSGALAWCICAAAGALIGWKTASVAFRHAFDSYDNHDSAAPLLLAAPIWLVTFTAVSSAVCGLLLLLWRHFKGRQ